MRQPLRAGCAAALVGLSTSALVAVGPIGTAAAQQTLAAANFVLRWTAGPFTQDKGAPIAESSPVVANLDTLGPAVVVGDRGGNLFAFHLADGSPVVGWPVSDGGAPIDSTPSVAAIGGATLDSVFVGTGNAQDPDVGGYAAYGPNGKLLWQTRVTDPASDNHPAAAVQASLTVADLQGAPDVFAGSLDQQSYALNASDGSVLPGFPVFTADSVFSTAAAGDLYGTGHEELVMGGASSSGSALGVSYSAGGILRVINAQGEQIYRYDTNQEVDSSPAIGDFLAGGTPGIVVGTGSFYPGASDTDTVKAFTTRLGLVWSDTLDGLTRSSPAVAAVEGGTQLDVVEGTDTTTGGSVWVLNGATGATIWRQPVVGRVIGSVVTADLTGAGYQDLLVPTTQGVEVLDGRTGAEVTVLASTLGFQNSPLVTDDPNGTAGITIAGYNGTNQGVIKHYEIPGSNGALAVGAGSWPMFHHDPGLTGASSVLPDLGRLTPIALTAKGGNGEASLSWSPAPNTGSPPTGYNVYETTATGRYPSTPVNGATPITGTTYNVTGLTNGTRYYFEVTAVNADGEGAPTNEAAAVPVAPPGPPTSVSATAGNAQVALTWVPPATSGGAAVSAYNVYMSTTSGQQGTKIAQVPGTSYTATGLDNGTTYYFEVTAVNAYGESVPSAQVTATPFTSTPPTTVTTPGAPGGLLATAGNDQVSLSWSPPASNGGAAVSSYNVYLSTMPGAQGAKLASVMTTSYTATDLQDGTTYYFEVTAVNSVGEGLPSSQVAAAPAPDGYRVASADGQVFRLGKLPPITSPRPGSPVVGVASTPGDNGYWLALKNGGVVNAGDAHLYGSMVHKHLSSPIAGIAATTDGRGYWLVAANGDIFGFGNAHNYGSLGATPLNQPIVGIAATPDGRGYWLVGADGGMFAFGDARFYGSMGGRHLNQKIVGMAATRDGRGYWLVAADGGIFAFGDATFHGSMASKHLNQPIVGIAATADGRGYWMVAADGGVFGFGNASFFGSLGARALHVKVVGIAV